MDLPRLQVAVEIEQDVVGVAMKVEQRGHQRRQNSELIDLRGKPKKKKNRDLIRPDFLGQVTMTLTKAHQVTHVILQQHKHAALCQLFGRHKLSPGPLDVSRWDFPAPPPLVVKVQPLTVHLL